MRKVFVMAHEAARANAVLAVEMAPAGAVIEIKDARRTLDQNAKLWAMLTDLSE